MMARGQHSVHYAPSLQIKALPRIGRSWLEAEQVANLKLLCDMNITSVDSIHADMQ